MKPFISLASTVRQTFVQSAFCRYLLLAWIAAEILAIFVLPFLISDQWYLQHYLPDRAIESGQKFLRSENANLPFAATGWVNAPNMNKGNWQTDTLGTRSSQAVEINRSHKKRVLILGSSLMNGGESISNQETLSAFLTQPNIEVINFGVMGYGVDQSAQLLQSKGRKLKPDLVIVGIDSDPIGPLQNHYVPLRLHEETGLAYLKPKFELTPEGKLSLRKIDPEQLKGLPENQDLLHFLKEHDGFYHRFEEFKRFNFTPIAYRLGQAYQKTRNLLAYFEDKSQDYQLLSEVMKKIEADSAQIGAKTLFLVTPNQKQTQPGKLHQQLPDTYQLLFQYLKKQGHNVTDIRSILRASAHPVSNIFHDDHYHFTKNGYNLMAQALKPTVEELLQ